MRQIYLGGLNVYTNSLNTEDLESVTVLKDAASAAIYGARASGGVILITTKNGKSGKMKVSYSGSFGFQNVTTYPKQLNAYEHALLYTEAQKNDNPNTTSFTWTAQQIEDFRTGKSLSFDKMKYLLKSAPQTEHNISLSGGNDDHAYMFSVGYLYQDSPIRDFNYQRINIRFKEKFQIGKKLSLDINASFIPEIVDHPSLINYSGDIDKTVSNIFLEAYRRDATQPLFTSDGKWATIGAWKNLIGVFSPDGGFGKDAKMLTTGIASLKWDITKGLQLEGSYNGLLETSRNTNYGRSMNFYDPHEIDKIAYVQSKNQYNIDHVFNYHHQTQALMNYHNTFSNVHDLKLLFGASAEWARNNSEGVGRAYYLTNETYAIDAGSTDKLNWLTSGTSSDWAIASLFGRLNYIFNNKYYLESNFRYDGSSRFASKVRWGLFPSASVGWRISEEPFFKMLQKTIPELKLRASWGQVGNQSTSLYQYYPRLTTSAYYFGGKSNTSVSYANSINEALTWETKTTTNIGLDVIVLKNFNLTLDGFKDRTSGILMTPVVPSTFGMSAPVMNVGTVENLGWEAGMSYKNRYKDLGWGITFQISDAKNKVIEMIGSPVIINNMITEVGHEMNRWYGYETEGIFSSQEQVAAHAFQNIKTGIGDLIYKDANPDNKINASDRVDLGSSRPRFPFGLTLDLNWKNFDFSAFFQGVAKQNTYINGPGAQPFYRDLGTALKQHLDRWHQDDNGNWIPGYYPKMRIGGVNITDFSSFWLQNSAYVRLKNIQLGYTLPKRWTQKVKIDKFRVYGNAQNLLTFTKMVEGIDPEAPTGDGTYFPLYKSVSFGVNVSF